MKNVVIVVETDFTDLQGNRLEMKLGETYPLDDNLAHILVSRGYAQYAVDQVSNVPVVETREEKRARRWFTPFGQGDPDKESPQIDLSAPTNQPAPPANASADPPS